MQAADIPDQFPVPFANAAGAGFTRPIPEASQIGVQGGAASLTDGFPPLCFVPVAAGGIPPWGADFNGLLNLITLWSRWQGAGAPVHHDAALSTAIGGYPQGAVLHADTVGRFWISTVDDNVTDPDAGGAGWTGYSVGIIPAGQAKLNYTSATVLTLAPKNGGLIWIDGYNYPVPAGLTITNSGLSANTLYYVYVQQVAGVLSIVVSATTHAPLAANGVEVMFGDATKTLVGAVWTNASSQFADAVGLRNVATWYNRSGKAIYGITPSTATIGSGSSGEISALWRVEAVVWGDDAPNMNIMGYTQNSAQGGGVNNSTFFGLDGVAQALGTRTPSATVNTPDGVSLSLNVVVAEGHRVFSPFGSATGGTGTWSAQIAGTVRN